MLSVGGYRCCESLTRWSFFGFLHFDSWLVLKHSVPGVQYLVPKHWPSVLFVQEPWNVIPGTIVSQGKPRWPGRLRIWMNCWVWPTNHPGWITRDRSRQSWEKLRSIDNYNTTEQKKRPRPKTSDITTRTNASNAFEQNRYFPAGSFKAKCVFFFFFFKNTNQSMFNTMTIIISTQTILTKVKLSFFNQLWIFLNKPGVR